MLPAENFNIHVALYMCFTGLTVASIIGSCLMGNQCWFNKKYAFDHCNGCCLCVNINF